VLEVTNKLECHALLQYHKILVKEEFEAKIVEDKYYLGEKIGSLTYFLRSILKLVDKFCCG
jgi:hypothetical protein